MEKGEKKIAAPKRATFFGYPRTHFLKKESEKNRRKNLARPGGKSTCGKHSPQGSLTQKNQAREDRRENRSGNFRKDSGGFRTEKPPFREFKGPDVTNAGKNWPAFRNGGGESDSRRRRNACLLGGEQKSPAGSYSKDFPRGNGNFACDPTA